MDLLTPIAPIWVWPSVSVACLLSAGFLYTPEIRAWASKTKATAPDLAAPSHLPEQKIYTHRTVSEILRPIKEMSSLQIQRHAKPHIGKWARAQNIIRDMNEDENFLYAYIGSQKFGPLAYLAFRKSKWEANLETMDRGDRLAAEGKIVKLDYTGIYLGDCALVDEREEDDPF